MLQYGPVISKYLVSDIYFAWLFQRFLADSMISLALPVLYHRHMQNVVSFLFYFQFCTAIVTLEEPSCLICDSKYILPLLICFRMS